MGMGELLLLNLPGIICVVIGLVLYRSGKKRVEEIENEYGEERINKYNKEIKNNPQSLSEESKQIRKVISKPSLKQGIGELFLAMGSMEPSIFLSFLLGRTMSIIIGVILLAVYLVLKNKVFKKDGLLSLILLGLSIGMILSGVFIGGDKKSNEIVDYEDTPQYYEDMYDYYKDKDNWNKDFGDKYGYRLN